MQKHQNTITFIIIAVILILMVIGVYVYYFVVPKKANPNQPIACAPGDNFNILTGERCPGASSTTTVPAI